MQSTQYILLFIAVTKYPANLSKSTGEKHTCSICGRSYSFQSGLSKHMRSAHMERGLVKCTISGFHLEKLSGGEVMVINLFNGRGHTFKNIIHMY